MPRGTGRGVAGAMKDSVHEVIFGDPFKKGRPPVLDTIKSGGVTNRPAVSESRELDTGGNYYKDIDK
jgi:hypothetical protein